MEPNELRLLLPEPTSRDTKYSRGTVGFVTGSDAYPGAALLGVAGAQGTSPGFVRYVGPRRVGDLMLLAHPEVVVTESFASAGPAQAWVLGSGIGISSQGRTLPHVPRVEMQLDNLRAALAEVPLAVIDAGALDLIGATQLAAGAHHILTPHQGELCRLLNRLDPQNFVHPERLDNLEFALEATLRAAGLTGHTVLLKGSVTLVADPDGNSVSVGPNSPKLATAGTGDVLAGIIGGIAAQNPMVAETSWLNIARLAIELHSKAAELAADSGAVTASAVASAVSQAISR